MKHIDWAQLLPRLQSMKTPFYLYDLEGCDAQVMRLKSALPAHYYVHYAVKANNQPQIVKLMKNHGLGIDCVSLGELQFALKMGFSPADIVLAGVGKTDEELQLAIECGISAINVESIQELQVIATLASQKSKTANIAIRINPNINPNTHHYITTGLEENKFGILWHDIPVVIELLKSQPCLQFKGLHFHIGSQITDLFVFERLCLKANEAMRVFESHGFPVQMLNLGGGLGINYLHPEEDVDFHSYFKIFEKFLELPRLIPVHFELGRSLVGNFGYLISRVLYTKKGIQTNFIIIDAGMTDLMRPSLYQAYHKIINISSRKPQIRYDVVGPVCESSDTFGKKILLPETSRGDLIVICSTGAYGEVMTTNYNMRPKPGAYFLHPRHGIMPAGAA